ncbi:winged helix-turn-helix domain-containing protein [Paraglaciecola sp.]|uniref:winged helix-turn-helix domain-containing protein n=1 Tax=Paraglaciecola sp. TaxID=1920173 RepID=UPI003EF90845
MEKEFLVVGQCHIDRKTATAQFNSQSISLTDKSIHLMFLLAKAPDHFLSRESLLDWLWPDVIVSDDSLTNLISVTRAQFKQLGLNTIIKTVPKKGYCLVGEVKFESPTKPIATTKKTLKTKGLSFWILTIVLCLSVLLILISANNPKDTLTLAILPVELHEPNSPIRPLAKGLEQELQQTAVKHNRMQVLSKTQVENLWSHDKNLFSLKQTLNADYAIESQIREQEHYLRLTLQLVNVVTSKTLFSEEFDVATSLLSDNQSEIWQQISQLFIQSSVYSLGIFEKNKAVSANQLCAQYIHYLSLYADSYLDDTEQIALKGQDSCAQAITLNPENTDTHRNIFQLYTRLAKSEKNDMDQRLHYLDKADDILSLISTMPNSELLYAESLTELLFLQVLQNTRELDIDALFKQAEEVVNRHEKSGNISATLAKNGAILRHHHAKHFYRTGKNPDSMILKAIELIDQGLKLDVDDYSLIHTKARIYKTWSSIAVVRGEDPSQILNHAISLYKRMIKIAPKQPAGYDALANAYSSLAKYKSSTNKPYQQEFTAAIKAYSEAIKIAPSHHFTYNNMADLYAGIITSGVYSEAEFNEYAENAIQSINSAMAIKKEYVWAMFNLANLHSIKAQLAFATDNNDFLPAIECEQHFTNGLILKPTIPEAITQLAQCKLYIAKQHLMLGQITDAEEKMQDVTQTIDRSLSLNPNFHLSLAVAADAQLIGNLIAISQGEAEQNIEQLDEAITLANDSNNANKEETYGYLVLIRANWLKQKISPSDNNAQALETSLRLFKDEFAFDQRIKQLSKLLATENTPPVTLDLYENYRDFIAAKELQANYQLINIYLNK